MLTDRQIEIAQLKADGFSSKQIAVKIGMNKFTVRWHMRAARKCLGVHTFHEVVMRCYAEGKIK